MPTILSRVRTYSFADRTMPQQKEVISRVYHEEKFEGSIDDFLLTFLPVNPNDLRTIADKFFKTMAESRLPEISGLIKECSNFDPRIMLKIFLTAILDSSKKMLSSPNGAEASKELSEALQSCWNNITVYNQSITSAMEILVRDMSKINKIHGNVYKWAVM